MAWCSGWAPPARMTRPATGARAATRGATVPPSLCPATKTRAGSTAGWPRSSPIAATACGTYSSVSVKCGFPATRSGCARVTFSNRSTATPAVASPQARSLSGLFRPMVSSWSFGPEPASRTTPGTGAWPARRGTLSVPGTASGPSPTVTSCSVNASGSAYGGGSQGAAGAAALAGSSWMPVIQGPWSPPSSPASPSSPSSPARPTARVAVARSNVTGTFTSTVPGPAASVSGAPSADTWPFFATSASQAARSASGGASGRSWGRNLSLMPVKSPRLAISMTASAVSASVIRLSL